MGAHSTWGQNHCQETAAEMPGRLPGWHAVLIQMIHHQALHDKKEPGTDVLLLFRNLRQPNQSLGKKTWQAIKSIHN